MMILYRETSWWYWVASELLIILGLAGARAAFVLAAALAAVQIVHFRLRDGSFAAFPVQVRIGFAAVLAIALLPGMRWLFWLPAIGVFANVAFGYCLMARCLSLLPWNRRERFSAALLWRTFTARPVRGSILQGLPAAG